MKQQKKWIEKRGSREQLNSVVVCLTKAPHTSIYRSYHSIMEFNGMNVTTWNWMSVIWKLVTYVGYGYLHF